EVELPPKRGRILDRTGVTIGASAEIASVYANPRQIGVRARAEARELAEILHLDAADLEKRLRSHRFFTWVKRRVLPEEAQRVREAGLDGIFLAKEPRRYYPNRSLGGPLLGWAGLDSVGQEGIELYYDKWLRGTKAQVSGLKDALG